MLDYGHVQWAVHAGCVDTFQPIQNQLCLGQESPPIDQDWLVYPLLRSKSELSCSSTHRVWALLVVVHSVVAVLQPFQ